MASNTSGRSGVVALLSRYTRCIQNPYLFYASAAGTRSLGGQGRLSIAEIALSLVDGDVVVWILRPDILCPGTDKPVVVELFDHVCGPSADAGYGEDWREKVHVNTQRVIGRGGVEIDIRVQLLIRFHELLNLVRDFKPFSLPAGVSQIARHDAQMRGAR